MQEFNTLQEAIQTCLSTRRFTLAHLHREEPAMDMHIHDCYEVYYTISGGNQFLIGERLYDMVPGDLFCINTYESHHIMNSGRKDLERVVFFIHPDFITSMNTPQTQLDACFKERPELFSHRQSLSEDQQRMFAYHVTQIFSSSGYGADVLENSRMMEFLVFLNRVMMKSTAEDQGLSLKNNRPKYTPQVQQAITYINEHLQESISLSALAEQLFLSESYLCRIFKASTGTTISKYIVGRRISIAKSLLASGCSVAESQVQCGFSDYSNFLKAFTRAVGMSPKKYSQLCRRSDISPDLSDDPLKFTLSDTPNS